MEAQSKIVLITGGSNGIGKSLAKKFVDAGSRVLVTGRNKKRLQAAQDEIPGLEIYVNDIGVPEQRIKLAGHIKNKMPGLNILINNAGIQRRIGLAEDNAPWTEAQEEINILLSAPIHLNQLLIPIMLSHGQPSLIVNVSSGGAYIPQNFASVYSACKAAVHSYTVTLRQALEDTTCSVIELIPPAVQTGLANGNTAHGVPLEEFTETVFKKLIADGITEIGFGPTENVSLEISGKPQKEIFEAFSKRFPVKKY